MLRKCAGAVLLTCVCVGAQAAHSVDLSCGDSVSAFFAPLVQKRLIDPKPIRVAEGSVNHFRPKFMSRLDAYGMPVVEVFGYGTDPLLFMQRGDQNREVYGVIVREGIANVQAQLNSVGATEAKTFRVDARNTAIVCKGDYL